MYPAIIVIAFDRPASLVRLLRALEEAAYPRKDIPLVISIDGGGDPGVEQLAQAFRWPHGPKIVLRQARRLGLREHVLRCGDLTATYGSAIILEDDLLVSPYFYDFARQAMAHYAGEDRLAGFSLYHYEVTENGYHPFRPMEDGSDVYFMQVAASWGWAITADQWRAFRSWLERFPILGLGRGLPDYIRQWSDHSWKKHFIHHLVDQGKYFLYPRWSLATNFEDPGTHAITRGLYQVPLQRAAREFRWGPLEDSRARYDAWFEWEPDCLRAFNLPWAERDMTVDLHGTKPLDLIGSPFLLTAKPAAEAEVSFGRELIPLEANLIAGQPGDFFRLAPTEAVRSERPADLHYFPALHALSGRTLPAFAGPGVGVERVHSSLGCTTFLLLDGSLAGLEVTAASLAAQDPNPWRELILLCRGEPLSGADELLEQYGLPVHAHCQALEWGELWCLGLERASGGYLHLIRAGEALAPGAILHQLRAHRAHPDIAWTFGQVQYHAGQTKDWRLTPLAPFRCSQRLPAPRTRLAELPLAAFFWQRDFFHGVLTRLVGGGSARDLLYQAAQLAPPQPLALPIARADEDLSGFERVSVPWPGRHFFLRDLPYWRAWYHRRQGFPPVIRYEADTGAYWLNPY